MSDWSEVFLGIIAVATLATASSRFWGGHRREVARQRVDRLADQVERDLAPLLASLNAIGEGCRQGRVARDGPGRAGRSSLRRGRSAAGYDTRRRSRPPSPHPLAKEPRSCRRPGRARRAAPQRREPSAALPLGRRRRRAVHLDLDGLFVFSGDFLITAETCGIVCSSRPPACALAQAQSFTLFSLRVRRAAREHVACPTHPSSSPFCRSVSWRRRRLRANKPLRRRLSERGR